MDLQQLDIKDLKSMIYDSLVIVEQQQINIRNLQVELVRRNQVKVEE